MISLVIFFFFLVSTKTLNRRRQRQRQRQRELSSSESSSSSSGIPTTCTCFSGPFKIASSGTTCTCFIAPLLTTFSAPKTINKNIDLCVEWVPQKDEEGLIIQGYWRQVVILDEDEDWDV